ncbi:MAG: hypothetical protein WCG04_04960 [Alphaproteobacteria bacterium]
MSSCIFARKEPGLLRRKLLAMTKEELVMTPHSSLRAKRSNPGIFHPHGV